MEDKYFIIAKICLCDSEQNDATVYENILFQAESLADAASQIEDYYGSELVAVEKLQYVSINSNFAIIDDSTFEKIKNGELLK